MATLAFHVKFPYISSNAKLCQVAHQLLKQLPQSLFYLLHAHWILLVSSEIGET
jgi:hypothetical protein